MPLKRSAEEECLITWELDVTFAGEEEQYDDSRQTYGGNTGRIS